jgi:hypothetical protein
VSDLVDLVQTGGSPGGNGFYWESAPGCVGMLESLRQCLQSKYGSEHTEEHMRVLKQIERKGSPRQWALLWLLCLPLDAGLQNFVAGVDDAGGRPAPGVLSVVENYVGTDGRRKCPSDGRALKCYLRDVHTALRHYVWSGVLAQDRARLYAQVASWHLYGGRAP